MSTHVRIASNIPGLDQSVDSTVRILPVEGRTKGSATLGRRLFRTFRTFLRADLLLLANPGVPIALLARAARGIRLRGPRIVYFDVLIPPVRTRTERIRRSLHLWLLRNADGVLTVHREVSEYARLMRIPKARFHFVGFKSNAWEDRDAIRRGSATVDEGDYVLACGRSYRDFATFAEATGLAGLPARILLPSGAGMTEHGSIPPPPGALPESLAVEHHDGSRDTWLECLLHARIVVVPLRGDVVQPAGVSVYLEAMSLSRPVIVTEGPSTRGLLDLDTAGIVRAGDPAVLAQEMTRLWHDEELRRSRIAAGYRYVSALGGSGRLRRDILNRALEIAGMGSPAMRPTGST